MKNIYIVKILKKYFKRLVKNHIYITYIKEIDDYYLLYLDLSNYEKLLKFKKIYNFEVVGYEGLVKYKNTFKKYYLFFIMFVLSLGYIVFLGNIIFKIEIKSTDQDIVKLVSNELDNQGISLYKFVKSFDDKELIKKNIISNNSDKLEWMEITRVGCKYVVNVEKRILDEFDNDNTPRDIVAKKNAIILKIDAKRGSIVKKLNDYVKKGEVIVTGEIVHKDSVVDRVRADAVIYGETWYNVHVSYPIAYYEKTYTGKEKKRLSLTFFDSKFNLFDKRDYQEEEALETKIIYHKFLPIKISLENVKEIVLIDDLYTTEEAVELAILEARTKILKTLPKDSQILSQKKLKIIVNNSTIDIDVFFKVYENITETKEIIVEGE